MSPRRHRLDDNHAAIRQAAEALGWYWGDCSQTSLGFDAVLVKAGRIVFAEVKDGAKAPSRQRLTPHEQKVHAALKSHGITVEILTTVEDLAVLGRELRARREEVSTP